MQAVRQLPCPAGRRRPDRVMAGAGRAVVPHRL